MDTLSCAPPSSIAPFTASPFVNTGRARVVDSTRLTHRDAPTHVRHVILDRLDSGLAHEVGDSLGVLPENSPELVRAVLDGLGATGNERICIFNGPPRPLGDWLRQGVELHRLSSSTVECLAEAATNPAEADELKAIWHGGHGNALGSADVVDALHRFPSARPPLGAFVASLGRLQPRLYSISSSPRVHPRQVHVTAEVVRFESQGRWSNGTTSRAFGGGLIPGSVVRAFVQRSPKFHLPANPDAPVIMVGSGVGIAPYRAFLEEREAAGAMGCNWLFFGNQHFDLDFLYRNELDAFLDRGVLTRLDLAFSSDTTEPCYVQDRVLEQASEIWRWLEDGAHFYVCGDAKRMAREVDRTLRRVVAEQGRYSNGVARQYVAALTKSNRYHRDVW